MITPLSSKAADAGRCALEQGKFWEYHDYLYEQASSIDSGSLKAAAAQLGLDPARFNQCLASVTIHQKVRQSVDEALNLGFQGAPAFLINGKKVVGPITFEDLRQIIDPLLAGSG